MFDFDIQKDGHIYVSHVPWDDQTEGSAGEKEVSNNGAWIFLSMCSDGKYRGTPWMTLLQYHTVLSWYRQGPSINLPCIVNCPICKSFNQEVLSYLTFFSPVVLQGSPMA